jgi:hypothetical protein
MLDILPAVSHFLYRTGAHFRCSLSDLPQKDAVPALIFLAVQRRELNEIFAAACLLVV